MRSWLPAAAIGGVLAVLAVGIAIGLRPGSTPTTGERADALAHELRCPDCQGLSVADSPTTSAREIRRQVDELVAGGATDGEVRAHFVARYGEWILLAPSSPAYLIIPLAAIVLAGAGMALWVMRRTQPGEAEAAPSDEDRRRVTEEAEALDA